jgi:hypothetical protein
MTRLRWLVASAALLLAAPQATASAQVGFFIGAGALMPMGDFGDYANTGFLVVGGVSIPTANQRVGIDLMAFYGRASHDGDFNEATNIPGAAAGLTYMLSSGGSVMPYVSVMAGALQHRYDPGDSGAEEEEETQVMFGGGAGLAIPLSSMMLFLDARYAHTEDTAFLSLSVGLGFGGGSQ